MIGICSHHNHSMLLATARPQQIQQTQRNSTHCTYMVEVCLAACMPPLLGWLAELLNSCSYNAATITYLQCCQYAAITLSVWHALIVGTCTTTIQYRPSNRSSDIHSSDQSSETGRHAGNMNQPALARIVTETDLLAGCCMHDCMLAGWAMRCTILRCVF